MAICSIKLPGTTPAQSGYHWAPFPAIFGLASLSASTLLAGDSSRLLAQNQL